MLLIFHFWPTIPLYYCPVVFFPLSSLSSLFPSFSSLFISFFLFISFLPFLLKSFPKDLTINTQIGIHDNLFHFDTELCCQCGKGTDISYGPWADRQKDHLYKFFFPSDYQPLKVSIYLSIYFSIYLSIYIFIYLCI